MGRVDRQAPAGANVKAVFLINTKSGPRRGLDLSDVIRASCASWEIELIECAAKEDVDAIVDEAEAGDVDVVFAVGGDGTVHETAKRLIGRKPALGIVPTGSGNGFARHIGLPMDPAAALRACSDGHIVPIDTASVNGAPFLGVMGLGFDALVAERFAEQSARGLQTYVRTGVEAFLSYHPDDYELEFPGERLRLRAFVIAVANSGQYGNNARVAPLASLCDQLLDVVVIENAGLLQAPSLLTRLFSGTIHNAPGVTYRQTPSVTIRRTSAGAAHLDGEPVTLPAELRIAVVPQSLRLLVPAGSDRI